MTKPEIIDCICELNKSAKPEFLAQFTTEDLSTYLDRLIEIGLEELL